MVIKYRRLETDAINSHQDSSCVLTGNSVHKERIERLWRDVTHCVSHMFISTFYKLEAEGVLNPDNEIIDIFVCKLFCCHS